MCAPLKYFIPTSKCFDVGLKVQNIMGEMIFGRKMIKANNLYHLLKSKTKADSSKEAAGKEQTVT